MTISCEWEFSIAGLHSSELLQAKGDRVMSALLDLESADLRVADSAVSLDTETMTMTIGLVVDGNDYQETVAHALTSIRTAIHAAGGSTPGWPGTGEGRASFKPHDFRAVPA